MNAYTKTNCQDSDHNSSGINAMESRPKAQQSKEDWVEYYANQMLRFLIAWGTCLGVSRQYLVPLRQELTESYEQPLKKSFIEATYQSSVV